MTRRLSTGEDRGVRKPAPARLPSPAPSARSSTAERFAETGTDLESALVDALATSQGSEPSAAEHRRRRNLGGRPPLEPGSATEIWKVRAPASLSKIARDAGARYDGGFSAFVRDAVREKLAAQETTSAD